jgi:cyclophilin family peptidyl-prolyl cis-trans isomerase
MERNIPRSRAWHRLAFAAVLGLVGCGKPAAPPPATPEPAADVPANSVPTTDKPANKAVPPTPDSSSAPEKTPDKDDFLRALGVGGNLASSRSSAVPAGNPVSFRDALRSSDDPPPDCAQPPDQTATGKSVFKLLKQVAAEWDTIAFVSPTGASLSWKATVQTSAGTIEIGLRPDLAPNHVRNFVALARAGYYDGLCFDRVIHDESSEPPAVVLDTVEAGCPLGTGEAATSHLGYWLKPEFVTSDRATHEEGTVGACRGAEVDTACCKFYITLTKTPQLDGNFTIFGKVTGGLDTVRRIQAAPVVDEDQDKIGSRRPRAPILIQHVTITVSESTKG